MVDVQGLAWFPGIEQVISASYTLAHGITPGLIQVEMAPQPSFTAETGTFVFSYGGFQIELPDCRVDLASFEVSSGGFVWRLAILDRRWRWAFGQISGSYNQYNDDGTPRLETRMTPEQLAELCLEAMGEQDYDLSQMPSDVWPSVDWNYEVPAQALANLADEVGCRVVLALDSSLAVVPTGAGEPLPDGPSLQADSLTIDLPERPSSLVIVGATVRYQDDLPLRAVGWNTDGTIRPLAELDYAPNPLAADGGFGQIDLNYCNRIADPKIRAKAVASVFHWYQIDPEALAEVAGYGPIADLRQILPLSDEQIDSETKSELDVAVDCAKPAQVFGVWFDPLRSTEDDNSTDELLPLGDGTSDQDKRMLCNPRFTVDRALGLVKFDEPVFRKALGASSGGQSYGPAQLRLRTSFVVRDGESWAVEHYERRREQDSSAATAPRYIPRGDVQLTRIARYTDYSSSPTIEENREACDAQADAYLDAAELEYAMPAPQTRIYAGLQPISPDGAIQQVTWSVGLQGATTEVSQSTDYTAYTISYEQRRLTEQVRQLLNRPPRIRRVLNHER